MEQTPVDHVYTLYVRTGGTRRSTASRTRSCASAPTPACTSLTLTPSTQCRTDREGDHTTITRKVQEPPDRRLRVYIYGTRFKQENRFHAILGGLMVCTLREMSWQMSRLEVGTPRCLCMLVERPSVQLEDRFYPRIPPCSHTEKNWVRRQ